MTVLPPTLMLWLSLRTAPYSTVNVCQQQSTETQETHYTNRQHELKDSNREEEAFRSSVEISEGQGGAFLVFSHCLSSVDISERMHCCPTFVVSFKLLNFQLTQAGSAPKNTFLSNNL